MMPMHDGIGNHNQGVPTEHIDIIEFVSFLVQQNLPYITYFDRHVSADGNLNNVLWYILSISSVKPLTLVRPGSLSQSFLANDKIGCGALYAQFEIACHQCSRYCDQSTKWQQLFTDHATVDYLKLSRPSSLCQDKKVNSWGKVRKNILRWTYTNSPVSTDQKCKFCVIMRVSFASSWKKRQETASHSSHPKN